MTPRTRRSARRGERLYIRRAGLRVRMQARVLVKRGIPDCGVRALARSRRCGQPRRAPVGHGPPLHGGRVTRPRPRAEGRAGARAQGCACPTPRASASALSGACRCAAPAPTKSVEATPRDWSARSNGPASRRWKLLAPYSWRSVLRSPHAGPQTTIPPALQSGV